MRPRLQLFPVFHVYGASRWMSWLNVFKRDFQLGLVVRSSTLSTYMLREENCLSLTLSQKDPPTFQRKGFTGSLLCKEDWGFCLVEVSWRWTDFHTKAIWSYSGVFSSWLSRSLAMTKLLDGEFSGTLRLPLHSTLDSKAELRILNVQVC